MSLRWGIAGTGRIAHDFVSAVGVLPPADHKVVAVAARTLEAAQQFAKDHDIPESYAGYEALAKNPNIDIVYVGVVHIHHFDLTKMMITHGKHVLCEMPLGMNKKQIQILIDCARAAGVFLMEAFWSRCLPVYHKLREILASGTLGDIKYVNVTFGFNVEDCPRLILRELGGGSILEFGVHTLQFARLVFRDEKVTKFLGTGFLNESEADSTASCVIEFGHNKRAILSSSISYDMPNEAVVVGTKGTVKIPLFWGATQLILNGETFDFPSPESKAKFNFPNSVGLSYEAEECRKCINKGLKENPLWTLDESLEQADLTDTWRKLVGVTYPMFD